MQFPPTPPSALVGGYKDRCDGLLQFPHLPVVATSSIDQMKVSRGPEIDRFLVQASVSPVEGSGFKADVTSDFEICIYSRVSYTHNFCFYFFGDSLR